MNPRMIVEKMLIASCELQGHAHKARSKCRERFRASESNEQNSLRIAVDGLVASVAERLYDPIEGLTEEASYQIGLSASFVRTYYVVTDQLMDGDLIEALVLLRKQLEVLARILELEEKCIADLRGKTPNIKHILKNGTGRIYGHLSEVAHFSTPNASGLLGINVDGDRRGPSLIPQFQESVYGYMELSHFTGIRYAQWMLEKMGCWYPDADFSVEHEIAFRTFTAAVAAGVLEVLEEPSA